MKILVTGSSGFVGSRICDHLTLSGHEVIRTSRTNVQDRFAVDITDPKAFDKIEGVGDIEAVVHAAGLAHRFGKNSPDDFRLVNVEGVGNVAEFARKRHVPRFIHLSSVLVYGTSSVEPVAEDHALVPNDYYSVSKLEGERAVAEICSAAGLNLTILRLAPVIGEASLGNVARLIKAIDRKRFAWIGDGRNKRSFVYVGDVARAIEAALNIDDRSSVFNVVGEPITVHQLVKTLSKRLNRSIPRRTLPTKLAELALTLSRPAGADTSLGRYRRTLEAWLANAVYSGEAFKARGFVAATPIEEALAREVDFYLAHK